MVENEKEADEVRRVFEAAGAESLDAARRQWWIGLREAAKPDAKPAATDVPQPETVYGKGFLAALRPEVDGQDYAQALPVLRQIFGDVALSQAFQRGYARGAAAAGARAEEIGAGVKK